MSNTPLEQLTDTLSEIAEKTRSEYEKSKLDYLRCKAQREAKTMFDRQLLEEIYVMLKTKL